MLLPFAVGGVTAVEAIHKLLWSQREAALAVPRMASGENTLTNKD